MKCRKCNVAESTGFVIHLCDKCFDEWEANLNKVTANGDKYKVPEEEVTYFVKPGEN